MLRHGLGARSQVGLAFGGSAPGGAVTPWYLAGGIAAADCLWAHQAKGAASYAVSLVNLNAPGTRNWEAGTAPAWDTAIGYTFTAASNQYLKLSTTITNTGTILVRATQTNNDGALLLCTASDESLVLRNYGSDANHYYTSGTKTYLGTAKLNANHVFGVANATAYLDGASVGTISSPVAMTAVRASLGANWPGYGPYNTMSGTIQCDAAYIRELTAVEIAAVSAAMAAL